MNRILKPKGNAILEIPNKRNLLTIIRYLIGKNKFNPFTKDSYQHNETFLNFHPKEIFFQLNEAGFKCESIKNTNFLRLPFLKRYVPTQLLVSIDKCLQAIFSFMNLSPSIIVLIRKVN